MALTLKLGSLHPSTEKLRHLGNCVTESAWTTTLPIVPLSTFVNMRGMCKIGSWSNR